MRGFTVEPCERGDVKNFIECWHYSHSINGVKSRYCFKLLDARGDMIGAALFAAFGMAGVWRKYGSAEYEVLELRRLCCVDNAPKNTESFFIAKMLRWLAANTPAKVVISYADQFHGHTGVIYRAANFEYLGTTSPSRFIEWNGKHWHEKTIRTYHNGKLKPYAQKIRDALERGEARYVDGCYKHIYRYRLRR